MTSQDGSSRLLEESLAGASSPDHYVDKSTDPLEAADDTTPFYQDTDAAGQAVTDNFEKPADTEATQYGQHVSVPTDPPILIDASTSPLDGHELDEHEGRRNRLCCRHCTFDFNRHELLQESKMLLALSWPTSLYLLLNAGIAFAPIVYTGHLGTTELAAASLSISVIGAVVRAVGVGFTSACDTFFSQTYGSANKTKVGVVLQKSLLCTVTIIILAVVLCLNAEPILLLLGQDPTTSAYAGVFLTLYIPGIPAEMISFVLVKYLQCHSILLPIVAILLSVNIINTGCLYIFIFMLDMGFRGAPLALIVTDYLLMLHLLAFIYFKGIYKATWSGWSKQCLEEWGKFFKLGAAGALMVSFEWWSFEIGVFLAGILGETETAVQGIGLHLITLAYMVPFGVSIALGIRVGHKLGGNKPKEALLAAFAGILVCWLFAALETIFFLSLRNHLGYIFTKEEELVEKVSGVILIIVFLVPFDNTAAACSGIVRGTGRQVLGAGINLFGFYFIGLPVSVWLMFSTPLQIQGYWVGQTFGLFAQSVMFLTLVCNFNWPLEAKRALKTAGIISVAAEEATTEVLSLGIMRMPSTESLDSVGNPEKLDQHGQESGHIPSSTHSPSERVVTRKESMQLILIKRLLLLICCVAFLLLGIICRTSFFQGCPIFPDSDSTCLNGTAVAAHI